MRSFCVMNIKMYIEHGVQGKLLVTEYLSIFIRAQTVLCGVVAPCYQHHQGATTPSTTAWALDYISKPNQWTNISQVDSPNFHLWLTGSWLKKNILTWQVNGQLTCNSTRCFLVSWPPCYIWLKSVARDLPHNIIF